MNLGKVLIGVLVLLVLVESLFYFLILMYGLEANLLSLFFKFPRNRVLIVLLVSRFCKLFSLDFNIASFVSLGSDNYQSTSFIGYFGLFYLLGRMITLGDLSYDRLEVEIWVVYLSRIIQKSI